MATISTLEVGVQNRLASYRNFRVAGRFAEFIGFVCGFLCSRQWVKAARLCKKMLFLVTVWAEQFEIILSPISWIMVSVVKLENAWHAIISATITFVVKFVTCPFSLLIQIGHLGLRSSTSAAHGIPITLMGAKSLDDGSSHGEAFVAEDTAPNVSFLEMRPHCSLVYILGTHAHHPMQSKTLTGAVFSGAISRCNKGSIATGARISLSWDKATHAGIECTTWLL